jgi:HEPN domain-containing protein
MRLEVPVPKTHNLRELSELLEQADAGWSAASIDLNRLSLAAVDFRYPDPSEPELDIGLPLIQSIAADLRVRLLDRLGGGR